MEDGAGCFVSGFMAKVLRLARVAGIAPLSFEKKNTGWRVRVSRGWSIYGKLFVSAIVLTAMAGLITDFCIELSKPLDMQNNRRRAVWFAESSIMFIIAITAAFRAPGYMRSIITCLNYTQKINRELNIYQWPISKGEEQRKSIYVIFWVIAIVVLGSADFALLTYKSINYIGPEKRVNVMFMAIYWSEWINNIQAILFTTVKLHVVHSFSAVNDRLRRVYNDIVSPEIQYDGEKRPLIVPLRIRSLAENNTFLKNDAQAIAKLEYQSDCLKSRPHHETIHTVARVYVSMCDVVREVDRCQGFQVVLILLSCLLQIVVTMFNPIYVMFKDQASKSKPEHLENLVFQISWIFYYLVTLMFIIEASHISTVEMEMTRELVSRLLYCPHSVDEPLAVELELFSRQLMLNQVSYSPMKVISLTRSLMVTILGSITTYLAVLINLMKLNK